LHQVAQKLIILGFSPVLKRVSNPASSTMLTFWACSPSAVNAIKMSTVLRIFISDKQFHFFYSGTFGLGDNKLMRPFANAFPYPGYFSANGNYKTTLTYCSHLPENRGRISHSGIQFRGGLKTNNDAGPTRFL